MSTSPVIPECAGVLLRIHGNDNLAHASHTLCAEKDYIPQPNLKGLHTRAVWLLQRQSMTFSGGAIMTNIILLSLGMRYSMTSNNTPNTT